MNKLWGHFMTINKHKQKVTLLCFHCGLYKQGILHDLSKYSPVEFCSGVKYYQGFRSPINKEKEVKGYSLGWLHHKGRNKHHWEYWLDNSSSGVKAIEMPIPYVVEMVCDRIAASKTYKKDQYTNTSALEYFINSYDHVLMHANTKALTKHLLAYLSEHGEQETIHYIRTKILKNHK